MFVTPEVRRWHHSADVPEGHKYSVNYGVGIVIWDRLLGTYHLPMKDGVPVQPDKLGHPGGLADERNYLKLFFLTRYLPKSWQWTKHGTERVRRGSHRQVHACEQALEPRVVEIADEDLNADEDAHDDDDEV